MVKENSISFDAVNIDDRSRYISGVQMCFPKTGLTRFLTRIFKCAYYQCCINQRSLEVKRHIGCAEELVY